MNFVFEIESELNIRQLVAALLRNVDYFFFLFESAETVIKKLNNNRTI